MRFLIKKEGAVAEMGEEGWEWRFRWRRGLFVWENKLFQYLLQDLAVVQPKREHKDGWRWLQDPQGKYTVKSAYLFCILQISHFNEL